MKFSLMQHYFSPLGRKMRYTALIFGLIVSLVGAVNYFFLRYSQARIIEHEVVRIAEVAADVALTARSVYATTVDSKLTNDGFGAHVHSALYPGFVPLPAQFLKLLGQEISITGNGLYHFFPVSKWNIEPTQGLKDAFQREAWAQLEQQDIAAGVPPVKWQAFWRYETVNNQRVLRYMRADPAIAIGCINCHNSYEKRTDIIERRRAAGVPLGKQWKVNELLGAIEVRVPVDKVELIAVEQARWTLAVVLLTLLLGLAIASWVALRDVRRERQAAAFYEVQSKFDALTQLANRALFNERAEAALARAKRGNHQIAIMFIDLDYFKPINDTYGHHIGDLMLQAIAQRLVEVLRITDLVARQGGDEFLVLLESVLPDENLTEVAEKLLATLAEPFHINGLILTISASVGISRYPLNGADIFTLVEKADAAMYEAKRCGRSAYQLAE